MAESKLENDCCAYGITRGWWNVKFKSPSRNGLPDRLFIRNGIVVFVEFKKEGEDLRPQQKLTVRLMRTFGATVYEVDDYATFCELFK